MKALVTVELQLCGDLFFSLGRSDSGKNKVNVLLCAGLVRNNAIVVEISDDRKIQESLSRLDVRNICHPLLIRSRSPYILRLSSLPFCEREKIPQQLIFHLQSLVLVFVLL